MSSIGAHWDSGVGLINGLHDVEGLLDEAATHVTHLRPGFFFENLLWQLDSIRKDGRISLLISGDYPQALGPYTEVMQLMTSGALQRNGLSRVSVAGHPEGHPKVPLESIV